MRFLLDIAYLFASLAYLPVLLYRMATRNRYRTGWSQRFGGVSRRHPDRKCIWIHAVSLGEINATRTVITELVRQLPDCEIVISTTTDTGMDRARTLFSADHEVFYFPLDFSCISRRAFKRLRPDLCLLMELEVWPNFLASANKFAAHVVVVNGRISEHSFKWYKRIRPIAKSIFSRLSLILAQTPEYAERFTAIGCPSDRVIVTGSLKYDTAQIIDKVPGSDTLATQLSITPDQRLLVAGATGNDEERILLDVYSKLIEDPRFHDVRLALVPRKPERFDDVAQQIQQAGYNLIRYSEIEKKPASALAPILSPSPSSVPSVAQGKSDPTLDPQGVPRPSSVVPPVILGDTMGDLRKFYSLSTVIFVGRSLVPMGGSDMMEAAALAKPTLFGPHATNFQQTVEALLADEGAICTQTPDDLLAALKKCLTDSDYAARIAANGRKVIENNQGATRKTVNEIARLLNAKQS